MRYINSHKTHFQDILTCTSNHVICYCHSKVPTLSNIINKYIKRSDHEVMDITCIPLKLRYVQNIWHTVPSAEV
jgi:hypothetical protein